MWKESIKGTIRRTDWLFLIFLVLVCNQAMLAIKLAGFVFIYLMRPSFRLGLRRGRLPRFYLLMPVAGILAWILHIRYDPPQYFYAFATGTSFWLLSLTAVHQIKLSLELRGRQAMDATLKVFTTLNFIVCLGQLIHISLKTGFLNPYHEHLPFPYGMSSGDLVFGVLFENSTYNVIVSLLLTFYFLFRNNWLLTFAAATSAVIVFSNFGNTIFLGVLLVLFVAAALKKWKPKLFSGGLSGIGSAIPGKRSLLTIPLLIVYVVLIYQFLSPQNFHYLLAQYGWKQAETEQPQVAVSEIAPAPSPIAPVQNDRVVSDQSLWQQVRSLDWQKYNLPASRTDSADKSRRRAITQAAIEDMEGKKLSFMETGAYLYIDPRVLLTGAGIGRFSSLTAHRISGGDTGRLFKIIPKYKDPLYLENHGLITQTRLEGKPEQLAGINWPESFYNQLAGEYGILGIFIFLVFYVRHYLRRRLSYGFWAAALMVPFAMLNYLFEALCPIIILEILLELDTFKTPDTPGL